MTEEQIRDVIAHYAHRYPDPLLTSAQAAAIAGRSVGTIHNWSSLGRLGDAKSNAGRLRIHRDAFVRLVVAGPPPAHRRPTAGAGGGAARPSPPN